MMRLWRVSEAVDPSQSLVLFAQHHVRYNRLMRHIPTIVACIAVIASPVHGCIWDSDTLAAERARFPEVAELITGYFARHSREFYAWRLLRSEELIKNGKAVAETYDDLAVSQHKLGDHKAAIATMEAKEKLFPGKYETFSNLGTFYIYTGDLNQAQAYIRKALAINPNAHFGREKYQLWLVEWLQARATANDEKIKGWSVAKGEPRGFAEFVIRREKNIPDGNAALDPQMTPRQQSDALRGIMGMMWFADFDNPLLLEALGDVLVAGPIERNAAQLAAFSYLHAADKTSDFAAAARLRQLASGAGIATHGFDLAATQKVLKDALEKGRAYVESVRKDEIEWLRQGLDAEQEFQKKYLRR